MESPDELTLRAEETCTWKSCINVSTTLQKGGEVLLVDADWHAFCQALYKGIEGEDYDAYKEMSWTVGGCPESKSPLENDGSQGCTRRILRSHA